LPWQVETDPVAADPPPDPASGPVSAPASASVAGTRWFRAVSTTSTFAVRAGVLRQDGNLLRAAPYTGGAWDHTTCMAVQGAQPFSPGEVRRDLIPFLGEPAGNWPRAIVRGATRAAINLRSQRRPERRRTLYGSDPLLALHLETIGDGRVDHPEWLALAEETRAWSRERGTPLVTG
jgi:hypothetical protein